VLKRWPRAHFRKHEMLVLDAFKGHLTPKIRAAIIGWMNTDLVVIPRGGGGGTPHGRGKRVGGTNPQKDPRGEGVGAL